MRQQTKRLILLVGYSFFLLLMPYMFDHMVRTNEEEPRLQPRRCFKLESKMAKGNGRDESGKAAEIPEKMANSDHPKTFVYLHTTWRTGSSFLGELFNQHPDVFYIYEPMWNIWQVLFPGDATSLQGAVRDMMNSLFRCDFSAFKLYASTGNFSTSMIFGWKTNKVICSEPMCKAYKRHEIQLVDEDVCGKCQPRDLKDLEIECKRYPVVVIKDVRVLDLGVLVPLMRDPSLNLKVIQLFRDPRAVHNSRLKSKTGLLKESIQLLRSKRYTEKYFIWSKTRAKHAENFVANAMAFVCESWLNDLLLLMNAPEWMKRSYMDIRYENLVYDPIKELKRLYRFSNLSYYPAIGKFALNMTHGESYSSEKPFLVSPRDAKEAVFAWRERLSVKQISEVESFCAEVMNRLDYNKKPGGQNVEQSRSINGKAVDHVI